MDRGLRRYSKHVSIYDNTKTYVYQSVLEKMWNLRSYKKVCYGNEELLKSVLRERRVIKKCVTGTKSY